MYIAKFRSYFEIFAFNDPYIKFKKNNNNTCLFHLNVYKVTTPVVDRFSEKRENQGFKRR